MRSKKNANDAAVDAAKDPLAEKILKEGNIEICEV